MSHIIKLFSIFVMCFLSIQGCFTFLKGGGKNAYKVDIDTTIIDESNYRRLNLSDILFKRGYKQDWAEKPVSPPDFTGQSGFYSAFGKMITKEGYSIDVYINYAQAKPHSLAKRLHIWIVNWTVGNLVPEVTQEINEVSEAIYQELVEKLGENKVTLNREEGNSPTNQSR